ncbi:hypothetical protein FY528_09335 [Hymenobacter lutimineralis]|uniref:Transmembrane protein n=1 Tax=Hymenobacter lutimineralis TaxID=2606448 RepID=A0A5D6V592_9BACT|nr:hypothetical protein [Hymenobacter lutimineralis]TYZ10059.1 hypothetical protein FY528_09335 [Hymenobacter lutimineralis]
MRCYLILLACLLGLLVPGRAQQVAIPDYAVVSAPVAADSAHAVGKLFSQRRAGARLLRIPGLIALGVGAAILFNTPQGGTTPVLLGGAMLTSFSVAKSRKWSSAQEHAVQNDYLQGKPLPKRIRRRLRHRHFQP